MPEDNKFEGVIDGYKVLVEFRSSSTKDGKEGFKVVVTDGAERAQAEKAQEIAEWLRSRCIEVIEQGERDRLAKSSEVGSAAV